jgi:hypothetical protein
MFSISFSTANSSETYSAFESEYRNEDIDVLLTMVEKVSQDLKPGTVPGFVTIEFLREYGYGSCGEYNLLLMDDLEKLGIESRSYGIKTTDGRTHAVLDVKIGDKWVLTNPMMGIVYKHSFWDMLEHPKLADEYWGTALSERGAYYDSDFFAKVMYFVLPKMNEMTAIPMQGDLLSITNGEIQMQDHVIHIDKESDSVLIKWNRELQPKFLSLKSLTDFMLIDPMTANKRVIPASQQVEIYITEDQRSQGELRLAFHANEEFRVDVKLYTEYWASMDTMTAIPFDDEILTISGDAKHIRKDIFQVENEHATLTLKWKKSLMPQFISLFAFSELTVTKSSTEANIKVQPAQSGKIYLTDQDRESGELTLLISSNADYKYKLQLTMFSERSILEKNIEIFTPANTFLSITGAPVSIDEVIINCDVSICYSLDVGNTALERTSNRFLYSMDNMNLITPANTWGPVEWEGDRSFRVAGYYEDALNKQAAIVVAPSYDKVKDAADFKLTIKYKSKTKEQSFVYLFDHSNQQYVLLGELPFSKEWCTAEFQLKDSLLQSLLLN